MRDRRPYPLLLALVAGVIALAPRPARAADENLLHGPHPFLKDNELSVHALIGEGQGDAMSGAKLELEYGYKLTAGRAPWWLNLLISFQNSSCNPTPNAADACAEVTGNIVETMAGVKWKLALPLPIVPFVRADAGFVFAFPHGATDAQGVALRAAGGANYFFFDWLGLGFQVGFSLGRIDYDSTFHGSHTYSVVDFGGGVEFQF